MVLLVAILASLIAATFGQDPQKNVLFIIVDDLGWADVPKNNGGEYLLPNIEAEIFDKGIDFRRYYTAPVCTPTRASFMTGKYAWKLGLQDVQTMPPAVDERIPTDVPTIAQLLQAVGYVTYYVGKWHIGYARWADTPIGRGFDYAYGYLQGEGDYYNHTMHLNTTRRGDIVGYDMFDMNTRTADWDRVGEYANDIYEEKALEYLENQVSGGIHADQPFYMYLSFQTIHEPIQAPPRDEVDYRSRCQNGSPEERRIYCEKMQYLDTSIGEVINFLKNNGLYDDTLIVFTTDNGGMTLYSREPEGVYTHPNAFYMPNSYGCNYPFRAGKATLFEGGIHAIGLLAGKIIEDNYLSGTGIESDFLIHAVDWFPTILEGAAGVDDVSGLAASLGFDFTYDGLNLLASLTRGRSSLPRNIIFPNLDVTNALKEDDSPDARGQGKGKGRGQTRVRKTILDTSRDWEYTGGYGDMPFDAVIFDDGQDIWKYMAGYQLYWNYYNCRSELVNPIGGDEYISENNYWETTTEWLFKLTENPNENESGNYLSSDYIITDQGDYDWAIHIYTQITQFIIPNAKSFEFVAEQPDSRFWRIGLPACNEGAWAPWLNDDFTEMSPIECDPGCDFDCQFEILTQTSG